MTITDALRTAIADSGQTLYRVAKETGIGYAVIHGFYNGGRDVKLSTVDKLASYLGLELRPKDEPPRKRRK